MESLDDDLVRSVAMTGPGAALKLACVCKRFRDAIEDGDGAVFDIRRSLLSVGETSLQGDLVHKLSMSLMHVKMATHTRKRNRYGGFLQDFHASNLCGSLPFPRRV